MNRVVMVALLLFGACIPACAEEAKVWRGQWRNRKYNTTGPLQCTAKIKEGGTWEGRFEGLFMKEKFDYTVTFDGAKKGAMTTFSGKAELDGDGYEWTGSLQGKTFTGKFKSLKGYYGEFMLQEK